MNNLNNNSNLRGNNIVQRYVESSLFSKDHSLNTLNERNNSNLKLQRKNEKIKLNPMLKVSVDLGTNKNVELIFYEDDNINEKIQKFAQIHNIKQAAISRLHDAVIQGIGLHKQSQMDIK